MAVFHRWCHEAFEFLERLNSWSGDVVLVLDGRGRRCSFPLAWTDMAPVDAFVAAARAFLREQGHLPGPGSARTVLHPRPLPPRSQRKHSRPREAPGPRATPKEQKKAEANSARIERRKRRTAVRRARSILQRLDQRFDHSADEQRKRSEVRGRVWSLVARTPRTPTARW